jgi:hypothetical protein
VIHAISNMGILLPTPQKAHGSGDAHSMDWYYESFDVRLGLDLVLRCKTHAMAFAGVHKLVVFLAGCFVVNSGGCYVVNSYLYTFNFAPGPFHVS